jgi:hypothetical protein
MPRRVESWIHKTSGLEQLAEFFASARDPWTRLHLTCAPLAFGAGSTRSFAEYFQGVSRVPARSLPEICEWLRGCECLTDAALFFQEDFWQHPLTFEQIRKGDCEDHALWAWRKLGEIGIPARLTAGRWRGVAHAWILLDQADGEKLLETTAKSDPMIRPVDATTRDEYHPALSVDHGFRTFVHAGYTRFHSGL